MKQWLEFNIGKESVFAITRNEFFRRAAQNSLIADVEIWMNFHKTQNSTSHEYSGNVAENVNEKAREFLPRAKDFVSRMERLV